MPVTLDDSSFLLHLPIKGILLDHDKVNIDNTLEIMVDYLRADLEDDMKELEAIWGDHARFWFLDKFYTYQQHDEKQVVGDEEQVVQHITHTLRAYLLWTWPTSDTSMT